MSEAKQPVKITQPIVGFKVLTEAESADMGPPLEIMHEGLNRPLKLTGSTYHVKAPPGYDSALYITINDMVLNAGTDDESIHPYEIFLNSKQMESFQWITALTVLVSGTWRKGGNITYVVDSLEEVFDPKGGYWGKHYFKDKQRYYNSVVHEIGAIIRRHMTDLGLMDTPPLSIKEEEDLAKTVKPVSKNSVSSAIPDMAIDPTANIPKQDCPECGGKQTMVMLDGCWTCAVGDSCSFSHCG